MTEKTLILVSELWQIDELDTVPIGTVVALDMEIEETLIARGIPYISAKDYRTPNLDFRDSANAWTKVVLENPEKPFIEYRGVSLGRVYFYPLYLYFTRVAYWIDIIANILERHQDVTNLVVYQPSIQANEMTGDLGQEEIDALMDSAKLVGIQKGIKVTVLPVPPSIKNFASLFIIKRKMFAFLLGVWNALMYLRSRRPIRILVSDYWRNVAPLLSHLSDAELIFIDRLQATKAGIANMWRWRMRFYHLNNFSNDKDRNLSAEKQMNFDIKFRGYDVGPILLSSRNALIQHYITNALIDIDSAYSMLKALRPSIILLRVSTAPQRHYAILAQVGRIIGIPSVEFQHGLEYNGSDSFTTRKNAQYVGVYGEIIKRELVLAGIAQERIEVVGSPRFDDYARVHASREWHSKSVEFSVLCIYPDFSYGDDCDSYDIDTFMYGVASALHGIDSARLTIKLRGTRREAFFRRRIAEICKYISHTIVRDTPLPELLNKCDVAVSCYSTAILEAMQNGTPLIFFATVTLHARFAEHFAPYLHAGAIEIARNREELANALRTLASRDSRNKLVERADRFLNDAYAFDGHGARRAAEFIRKLAQSK